ncbi:MAG: hydroxyisourate hydrolase [Ferruginibacter sp.]
MSQLTTHILDTTLGKPAAGVTIKLYKALANDQTFIAEGVTNADGRIPDLLPADSTLELGNYWMVFEVAPYFLKQGTKSFYPIIEIAFTIDSAEHYHVPLLLNPFGYSTYRGS